MTGDVPGGWFRGLFSMAAVLLSLPAKCVDGIEHRSPIGRVNAKNNPDRDRDQKGDDRRPGPNHHGDAREMGVKRRDGHSHEDADQPAGRADDCRLNQKLLDDVASPRPRPGGYRSRGYAPRPSPALCS